MNPLALYFASGGVFFSGNALIAVAVFLTFFDNRKTFKWCARILIIVGLLLIVLSSTPMSGVFFRVFGIVILALLAALEFDSQTIKKTVHALRILVLCGCFHCVYTEYPHHLAPRLTSNEPYEELFVLGDSISAGVGFKGEVTWVDLLKKRQGLKVVSLSSGGATLNDAIDRADLILGPNKVILLEIGGNDLLRKTPHETFERDLELLFKKLVGPGRVIIMFELPLPPFHSHYGRAQRRLANRYDVVLIPKRMFAAVLRGDGDTIDGLHLSNQGHQRLANVAWSCLAPLFRHEKSP